MTNTIDPNLVPGMQPWDILRKAESIIKHQMTGPEKTALNSRDRMLLLADRLEAEHRARTLEPADVTARARASLDGITPGDWAYCDIIGTDHNITIDGWDIARCTEGGARTPDEAKANATFIAEAPNLVRGLLAHVGQIRELAERWDPEEPEHCEGCRVLSECGADLRRALGREA